jgi:hypothetical protein
MTGFSEMGRGQNKAWLNISPLAFLKNWASDYHGSVGFGRAKIIQWIFLMPWRSLSTFFGAANKSKIPC